MSHNAPNDRRNHDPHRRREDSLRLSASLTGAAPSGALNHDSMDWFEATRDHRSDMMHAVRTSAPTTEAMKAEKRRRRSTLKDLAEEEELGHQQQQDSLNVCELEDDLSDSEDGKPRAAMIPLPSNLRNAQTGVRASNTVISADELDASHQALLESLQVESTNDDDDHHAEAEEDEVTVVTSSVQTKVAASVRFADETHHDASTRKKARTHAGLPPTEFEKLQGMYDESCSEHNLDSSERLDEVESQKRRASSAEDEELFGAHYDIGTLGMPMPEHRRAHDQRRKHYSHIADNISETSSQQSWAFDEDDSDDDDSYKSDFSEDSWDMERDFARRTAFAVAYGMMYTNLQTWLFAATTLGLKLICTLARRFNSDEVDAHDIADEMVQEAADTGGQAATGGKFQASGTAGTSGFTTSTTGTTSTSAGATTTTTTTSATTSTATSASTGATSASATATTSTATSAATSSAAATSTATTTTAAAAGTSTSAATTAAAANVRIHRILVSIYIYIYNQYA